MNRNQTGHIQEGDRGKKNNPKRRRAGKSVVRNKGVNSGKYPVGTSLFEKAHFKQRGAPSGRPRLTHGGFHGGGGDPRPCLKNDCFDPGGGLCAVKKGGTIANWGA